jgi:hypothetical protein
MTRSSSIRRATSPASRTVALALALGVAAFGALAIGAMPSGREFVRTK